MSKQTKKSSRNSTKPETNLFCEVLVDQVNNFMQTLKQKSLKKSSAKEVYDAIATEMKEVIKAEPLILSH